MQEQDTHELVTKLTRPHKSPVLDDQGQTHYVPVHAYLDQLHEAITGAATGGGGSSSRTRSPISLNAHVLWQEIAETTLEYWPGYGRPHLARTPLPRRIQQWAAKAINSDNEDDETTLRNFLKHWLHRIQALFEPSIDLAAPCPECKKSFIWRHDGVDNVKKRCLMYNQYGAWCNNCGTTWDGQTAMVNLARIINQDQPTSNTIIYASGTGEES